MHYAWAVPLLGLLIKTTTDMTEEEEIEREFAKVAAALERAEKEWNALSDDEKSVVQTALRCWNPAFGKTGLTATR